VDFQRHDLVAFECEDELKLDRTVWEISGEAVGEDGLAVFLNGRKRLHRVLVFLAGFSLPLLDRSQPFDRLAFVSQNGKLEDRQTYPFRLWAAKKLISGIPAKLDATSVAEMLQSCELAIV
jgi:hypothetical protein